jgi:hypothetical protein
MGHLGSTGSITLDVYSQTWWTERIEAVTSLDSLWRENVWSTKARITSEGSHHKLLFQLPVTETSLTVKRAGIHGRASPYRTRNH